MSQDQRFHDSCRLQNRVEASHASGENFFHTLTKCKQQRYGDEAANEMLEAHVENLFTELIATTVTGQKAHAMPHVTSEQVWRHVEEKRTRTVEQLLDVAELKNFWKSLYTKGTSNKRVSRYCTIRFDSLWQLRLKP